MLATPTRALLTHLKLRVYEDHTKVPGWFSCCSFIDGTHLCSADSSHIRIIELRSVLDG
jgi:hypothetical protein